MPDEVQPVVENLEPAKPEEAPKPVEAVQAEPVAPAAPPRPQGDRGPRPEKGRDEKPKNSGAGSRPAQAPSGDRGNRPPGGGGDRGPRPEGGPRGDGPRGGESRGGDRREGGRPNFGGGGRPFDGPVDIELEKLISDSLYLDNQAHVVVMRMRDMDSGTKSQLRRLYNAVRRAVRAPESERQHQFVMLRARLAYTIARHSLRSLDALERLLLQVTRKNDARGYERFKDLFEAIVAYNE
jgi:CRISPR type III-A-associated protein Csm2